MVADKQLKLVSSCLGETLLKSTGRQTFQFAESSHRISTGRQRPTEFSSPQHVHQTASYPALKTEAALPSPTPKAIQPDAGAQPQKLATEHLLLLLLLWMC
jgi:hypothetical protein